MSVFFLYYRKFFCSQYCEISADSIIYMSVHWKYSIKNTIKSEESEARLRAHLSVSEMNMKEIHHRIKNNLTMMISLMKLLLKIVWV